MAAPRKRTPTRGQTPPESVSFDDLLGVRDQIDQIDPGKWRAEVVNGAIVVSPVPVFWHERVCRWLERSLDAACDANDWFPDRAGEIELPATSDLICPDLMILSGASTLPDLESRRPLDRVLLVAEVISRSSIQQDREVKPEVCALAGIPMYLLVDRFARPLTISLHSEPGADGYATVTTVDAGQKLHLHAPFDLTLDTSTLPLPQ